MLDSPMRVLGSLIALPLAVSAQEPLTELPVRWPAEQTAGAPRRSSCDALAENPRPG